jgi:hypothetical protein
VELNGAILVMTYKTRILVPIQTVKVRLMRVQVEMRILFGIGLDATLVKP